MEPAERTREQTLSACFTFPFRSALSPESAVGEPPPLYIEKPCRGQSGESANRTGVVVPRCPLTAPLRAAARRALRLFVLSEQDFDRGEQSLRPDRYMISLRPRAHRSVCPSDAPQQPPEHGYLLASAVAAPRERGPPGARSSSPLFPQASETGIALCSTLDAASSCSERCRHECCR